MKRIRLDPEAYRQGHCSSVVLATAERARTFVEPKAVETCLAALKHAAARYEASIYAYCFMPDHLHLLVSTPDGVNLIDFVRYFKQLSAFQFLRHGQVSRSLWQSRFYDHALRSDEGVEAVARYVFGNPVRAGIVADATDYPYSGSLVWEDVLSVGV
jgi:putative transposase